MSEQTSHRRGLISPATKKFFAEGRKMEAYSFWDFLHGYVYARWPYLYIGIGKGDHPFYKKIEPLVKLWQKMSPPVVRTENPQHAVDQPSETFADGYHGKALPLDTARQLVMVNEPIVVKDLEQVIPYVRARSIIQNNPDHIVALDCPCRAAKENPCLPLDVCLVIGEPFASFILEHNAERSRQITQAEAVKILEEEDARGHVHHAFFKDAMLGRFYAICNCCACCCGAINAHHNHNPMVASSGFVAEVDQKLCIGCGNCNVYCQFEALRLGVDYAEVTFENCMGCGVCVDKCAQKAISLQLEPSKGMPLEICELIESAAGIN